MLYFFPKVPLKGSSNETNNVFLIIDYPGILTGHNNDLSETPSSNQEGSQEVQELLATDGPLGKILM